MGRNGLLAFVRLDFKLQGFKAWILFLVSAIRTPWDLLDHNLADIVDLEEMVKAQLGSSTLPTKGMRSIISTVSISLEGFLPSILLLVMIIVAVVIVTVILVVVVVVIVGLVIVVMIIRNYALVSDPLASGLC
ncbi:hypothetical protein Tco_0098073 [Tanacetum coccineum]